MGNDGESPHNYPSLLIYTQYPHVITSVGISSGANEIDTGLCPRNNAPTKKIPCEILQIAKKYISLWCNIASSLRVRNGVKQTLLSPY